ncbi:DRP1D, partial [Symbiodinium necroappetens]
MGSTFDKTADIKDVNVRNEEYQKADQREQNDINKFRDEVMNALQGERREYWDTKVGFKHVQSRVHEMSLGMDMSNLPRIISQIQQSQSKVELALHKTAAERKITDPEVLKSRCSKLVSALLADTEKFVSRSPGQCLSLHLSSCRALETAKTLLQEEEEFMQAAASFSSDSMKAAWNERRMSIIDYSRADEQAPDEFSDFYKGILEKKEFLSQVAQSEDPLIAGAAMTRAAEFFEFMALQYMYFDAGSER